MTASKVFRWAIALALGIMLFLPAEGDAARKYLSLGTGNPGGTFYFIGAGFANLFNKYVPDVRVIGLSMHEMSEIMGRIGLMGANLTGSPDYMMMDLFHYTGAGVRGLNNGAGRSFSIDNGTTLLKGLNNASVNGGDLQDWAGGVDDSFNALTGTGVLNALTQVDLRTMDVLGYDLVAVPEPSAGLLLAPALAIGGLVRRRNSTSPQLKPC